jgi:hypothetical protein
MLERDIPGQRAEQQSHVDESQLIEPRVTPPRIGAGRLAAQFLVDQVERGETVEIAGVVLSKEDLSNPPQTDIPEDTQKRG